MTGRLLRPSMVAATVAGIVCVATALAVDGAGGAAAALLGTALVLGFLLVGQVPVAAAAGGRRGLGAMLLLLGYTTRIALLLVAFRLVTRAGTPDRDVLGLTVMAVALSWTAGTVWTFLRWRPPVVDVELPRATRSEGGSHG